MADATAKVGYRACAGGEALHEEDMVEAEDIQAFIGCSYEAIHNDEEIAKCKGLRKFERQGGGEKHEDGRSGS